MKWIKSVAESLEVHTFLKVADTSDHANFWYDRDGNFTDKESEVVRKEPVEISRWRLAKTGEHNFIYDREFANTGMQNTSENHRLFHKELKKMSAH